MSKGSVFGFSDMLKRAKKAQDFFDRQMAKQVSYRGEQSVKEARVRGNYTDQTANLRNSIGYTTFKGGDKLSEDITADSNPYQGNGKGDKELAKSMAKKAIEELRSRGHYFSLIVVAGMNYAKYVEAKGYYVISPAEAKAKEGMMRDLDYICKQTAKRL